MTSTPPRFPAHMLDADEFAGWRARHGHTKDDGLYDWTLYTDRRTVQLGSSWYIGALAELPEHFAETLRDLEPRLLLTDIWRPFVLCTSGVTEAGYLTGPYWMRRYDAHRMCENCKMAVASHARNGTCLYEPTRLKLTFSSLEVYDILRRAWLLLSVVTLRRDM